MSLLEEQVRRLRVQRAVVLPCPDAIRGEGVHRRAMRTLRELHEAGFALTVSITITAENVATIPDFVRELDPLGLHCHMREVLPQGAGATLLGLDREQRRALFAWVNAYRGSSSIGLEDPTSCSIAPNKPASGCVAGWNHFCVDVSGDVFPCRPLGIPVGHVDDLDAAWDSPVMTRMRARDVGGACGRCELRERCGGCRVFAVAKGDLFGEDDRCLARENGLVRTPVEARAMALANRVGRVVHRIMR